MNAIDKCPLKLRGGYALAVLELLAPSAAHDINNLLLVMSVSLDLVEEDPQLLAAQLPAMRQALNRTAALNQQLLTCLQRSQQGEPEHIDVGEALSELAPVLGHLAGRRVRTTVDAGTCRATIRLGRGFFDQLVLNLVANSRDAQPSTVHVTARDAVRAGRRCAVIEVSDNGVGMLPETHNRIFEPFFTTKIGVGTGIGLATVRAIVEGAGGQIEFESTPGLGTTFQIWLPMAGVFAQAPAA